MSKNRKPSKHTSSSSVAAKRSHKVQKQNKVWMWVGLGLATIAIVALVVFLKPKATQAADISVAEAYQKYQQGAFFLDVRSQEEWDQVHIKNSILIPLDVLQNRLDELPRDRDIVVVCKSGHRSEDGMNILRQAGFSRAACMTGGLTGWQTAGYPLEGSISNGKPNRSSAVSMSLARRRLGSSLL